MTALKKILPPSTLSLFLFSRAFFFSDVFRRRPLFLCSVLSPATRAYLPLTSATIRPWLYILAIPRISSFSDLLSLTLSRGTSEAFLSYSFLLASLLRFRRAPRCFLTAPGPSLDPFCQAYSWARAICFKRSSPFLFLEVLRRNLSDFLVFFPPPRFPTIFLGVEFFPRLSSLAWSFVVRNWTSPPRFPFRALLADLPVPSFCESLSLFFFILDPKPEPLQSFLYPFWPLLSSTPPPFHERRILFNSPARRIFFFFASSFQQSSLRHGP